MQTAGASEKPTLDEIKSRLLALEADYAAIFSIIADRDWIIDSTSGKGEKICKRLELMRKSACNIC